MKHTTTLTAASLALVLLSGMANAQNMPAPGAGTAAPTAAPAGQKEPMRERMQANMAQKAAELKGKLQLRPEQESGWNAFVAAMKPQTPHRMPNRQELENLSTPERLDKLRDLRRQHEAEAERRDAATRTFYSTLSVEQKKTFDANSGAPMREHGSEHGHPPH